jgi:hypothetical protein
MTPRPIQMQLESIRSKAESGVPLFKQTREIMNALRSYLNWRFGLTRQLADAEGGEDRQRDPETEDRRPE